MQKPYFLQSRVEGYRPGQAAPTIKALSIRQPWAWLILRPDLTPDQRKEAYRLGTIKDLENRIWQSQFRGDIVVHAGKEPDRNWRDIIKQVKQLKGFEIPENAECGGLVGVVRVTDCVSGLDPMDDRNFWFQGPYAFRLADARPFKEIIPYNGKLGFFHIPIIGPLAVSLEQTRL